MISTTHNLRLQAWLYVLFISGLLTGLRFLSMPTESLHLQGRFDSYPKRRGLTRVPELLAAGLKVAFGQDSIRDPWYPLGNGNMLRTLDVGLHACHIDRKSTRLNSSHVRISYAVFC